VNQIGDNEYNLEHIDDVLKYKNELTNRTLLLIEIKFNK
jgi:hypothetical protein